MSERDKDRGPTRALESGRIVCGLQPVREALRAHGSRVVRVIIEHSDSGELAALARFAQDRGSVVERASRLKLDKLARGVRHQGAIAIAPELELVPVETLDLARVVALDEIEDPQNFGAIVRSAVALGATGVVWPEHHSAPLSLAMFRASAGAVEHAKLCRVGNLPRALESFQARGAHVIGLDANGDRALSEVVTSGPTVLVIGAEGKGLRKTVKSACSIVARLPMGGQIASLNASVAAGIALYETLRGSSTAT